MAELHEQAEKDYIAGMKYKEIAEKYGVSINTVKSWKKRHDWIRGSEKRVHTKNEKGCTQKRSKKNDEVSHCETEEIENDLTEKMKMFCVFFVKSFNATKSYMKAYGCDYASAAAGASRLLKIDKIQDYIRDLKLQRVSMTFFEPEDIVQKYIDIAFADIRDIADIDSKGTQLVINTDFDGTIVGQIKETKYGFDVKVNDRMRALEWLSKYFEMNPESKLKAEYMRLQNERTKIETNLLKSEKKVHEEEEKQYGVIELAPVLEVEEDEVNECNMDTTTEAD